MFNQSTFDAFVLHNDVIGFFDTPIILKSGKPSYFYVNWRRVSSDVSLLDQCADFVLAFCAQNQIDVNSFYGVPEGATKLGVITQYKWAKIQRCEPGSHVLAMGRSKPKPHGDPADRYFVGKPKGKVVLLEDVTTTGQSMLQALDQLQDQDVQVVACIGLTNREVQSDNQSVSDKVESRGVRYYPMSFAAGLVENLLAKCELDLEVKSAVLEELSSIRT